MITLGTTAGQKLAAAILRTITRARQWPVIPRIYAVLPGVWKARISRGLLRSAIGADQVSASFQVATSAQFAAPPPRYVDPRFGAAGVNLCGYVSGTFGLGESVRLFAQTLAEAGFPFSLVNFDLPTPARNESCTLQSWLSGRPEYPTSIYFVNPDQMLHARSQLEAQRQQGRYLIGFWFWELEHFPLEWQGALDLVDEIWVASSFVQRSMSAATRKPVLRMPLPIDLCNVHPDREFFGLPEGKFIFLFTFDYYSYPQRKNAEAVVAAFRTAFPAGRGDVCLLIKSINAERVADAHLRLVGAARGDPRIVFRDGHIGREEMYRLIASADAYVSLHRSEGFGLGMAEAMHLGKPVIATRYSGNLDFMSDEVARLVDCKMVQVPPGAYPHWQGQRWAEPDVEMAAICMRSLADDPRGARELGTAAAARIRRQYARSACASAVIARMQAIAAC